jgi:hypothetical protein
MPIARKRRRDPTMRANAKTFYDGPRLLIRQADALCAVHCLRCLRPGERFFLGRHRRGRSPKIVFVRARTISAQILFSVLAIKKLDKKLVPGGRDRNRVEELRQLGQGRLSHRISSGRVCRIRPHRFLAQLSCPNLIGWRSPAFCLARGRFTPSPLPPGSIAMPMES